MSSSSSSSSASNETILKSFTTTLYKFLCSLSDTFDECEKLKNYKQMFEEAILGKPFMEKMTIQKWHEAFVPLYAEADKRNMKALLDSKFWLLEEIDFGKKWSDPSITDEDRKSIWLYIDYLNGNARVYHNVPKSLQASLEKAASEMGDVNPDVLNSMDVTQMLKMTQKLVAGLSEDEIADLSKNMGTMVEGLGGIEGIMGFAQKTGLLGGLFGDGASAGAAGASAGVAGVAGAAPSSPAAASSLPSSILSGSLESAMKFMAGSTGAADVSIPGLTPELEEMFASIGSKLVGNASGEGVESPLESILKAMKKP